MRLKRGDLLLTALILFAAAAAFLLLRRAKPAAGPYAVISINGETVRSLYLPDLQDGDRMFTDRGITYIVTVREGGIAMKQIDCPDHICVKTGFIKDSGRPIVCMPNRLIISLAKDAAGKEAILAP